MSFSAASLAVSENGTIVTLDDRFYQWKSRLIKYLTLGGVWAINRVKCKLLFVCIQVQGNLISVMSFNDRFLFLLELILTQWSASHYNFNTLACHLL